MQPAPGFLPQDNPVHHDIDVVLAVLFQFDFILEQAHFAIDPDPDITVPPQLLEGVLVSPLLVADDRRHDRQS